MSEAQNQKTGEGQPSTGSTGTTPAATGAPTSTAPTVDTKAKTETTETKAKEDKPKIEAKPSGEGEKKPKKLSGDDDEIPEEEELVQMSPRALKARLTRASKAQLRDAFGTDDIDDIKKKIALADEATKKQEEERKARLTKEQKLQEELDAANKVLADTRTKLEEAERTRVVEKQDTRIHRIASNHVDGDYIEDSFPHLARAIRQAVKEGDKKFAKNEEAWIENWYKEYVEKKPKLGKDFGKEAEKPPTMKVPFTNGVQGKPAPQQTSGQPKTAAPGRPNSMSDAEIRQSGYSWK